VNRRAAGIVSARHGALSAASVLAVAIGASSYGQSNDLIRPPSAIDSTDTTESSVPARQADPDSTVAATSTQTEGTASSPPRARIAAPDPARPMLMEEVIVFDESEWRLPDLGSEWRQAQADETGNDRIELSFLPLYDPENDDPATDLFERNSELHRLRMIEVIRFRFGGRPQD
jgi:anti-sigma factor ChrR (cupin superfamily)